MTDAFQLVAKITPKPEHKEDVRNSILAILAQTRSEPGCLKFNLLEAREGDSFFLDEAWASDADLEAHYATPYVAPIFAQYEQWLERPVEIHKMTLLA